MRSYFFSIVFVLIFLSGSLLSQSLAIPEVLKFGDTKSNIMMALQDECKIGADRQIEPRTLPTAKNTQSQLDCERFKYAGKKRNMELVFSDGILDMVWILTEAEEKDTLIAGFTALYGEPTHINDSVTFFLNDGVAVRSKPHEVLFISDRLKPAYKEFFKQ